MKGDKIVKGELYRVMSVSDLDHYYEKDSIIGCVISTIDVKEWNDCWSACNGHVVYGNLYHPAGEWVCIYEGIFHTL